MPKKYLEPCHFDYGQATLLVVAPYPYCPCGLSSCFLVDTCTSIHSGMREPYAWLFFCLFHLC